MADNFNMKQFLAENKLGAYSKLKTEGEAAYEYEKGKVAGEKEEKEKLSEYEVIYVVRDGKCYRKDDEGNMDEVNMSYCRRYAEGKEEKVEEASQGSLMIVDRVEEIVNNLARNISTNSNIPTQEKIGLVQALKELKDLVEDLGADVEMGMSETKKPVEEALSSDYIDRMEGLANMQDLADFKVKLKSLASDWMKEGFEKEDVIEYVDHVLGGSVNEAKEPVEEDKYDIDAKSFGGAIKSDNPEGDALVLRFLKGIAQKFDYPVSHAAMFVKERLKKLGY